MSHTGDHQPFATSTTGPADIGQGLTPETGGKIELTVHLPYGANIKAIRALIRNKPWGQGECVLRPANWVVAPLDGREPMGWCRAKGMGQGTGPGYMFVKVLFQSWSNCNTREAQLEVDYEVARNLEEEAQNQKPIDESLWRIPYSS